jgi:hypothetical protein
MMVNVCAGVTDDADERGRADHQPFEPLVGEAMQPQKRQEAGDDW